MEHVDYARFAVATVVFISLLILLMATYRRADFRGFPGNIDEHDGDRRLKQIPFDEKGNPRPTA
ncbi:MAG: hypothetical protein AAB478_00360 [Patescibacteria group bacterium]